MSSIDLLTNVRVTISKIPRRGACYLVLCWIATILIALITRYHRWGGNSFAYMTNVVNLIALTLAIGAPVFLGVGVLFSTPNARRNILTMADNLMSTRSILIVNTVAALLVNGLGLTIIIIGSFLSESFLVSDLMVMIYMPYALVAALIISSILTLVSIPLSLVVDDWRMNTVLGSTVTIVLSTVFGLTRGEISRSSIRDLATWSPHNLFRALTLMLTGQEFENENRIIMYYGKTFSVVEILIPLLMYLLIAIILFVLVMNLFSLNLSRWRIITEMTLVDERGWGGGRREATSDIVSGITETEERRHHMKGLKSQRQYTVAVITLIVLSSTIGVIALDLNRTTGTTIILYESPSGGTTIMLDQWFAVEVTVPTPTAPLENVINWGVDILDWGNSPSIVRIQRIFHMMRLIDFWSLNESEKGSLTVTDHNVSISNTNGFSGYAALGGNHGQYVCAFRVSDPEGDSTAQIQFFLEIRRRLS